MASELTLERYDKDAQRIIRDGRIVAMCLRLANGMWGVYDTTESRKLLPFSYVSPRGALKALAALILNQGDAS